MTSKKFNPKKKNILNNPRRLKNIPMHKIFKILDLNNPENIVDYGAGTGYLTFYIADNYPNTRLFALDIEEQMINKIEKANDCDNLFPILINDNEMPFAQLSIDALISITVYHELESPLKFLKNTYDVLKKDGKILIIDWSINQTPEIKIGPPIPLRVEEKSIIKSLQNIGYKNCQIHEGFLHHFAISAEK